MRIAPLVCIAMMSAGCASTHVDKTPIAINASPSNPKYRIEKIQDESTRGVPDHFVDSIGGHLKSILRTSDMLSEDGIPATRNIHITIMSYRMRSGFTRILLGPVAGKDGIESLVVVTDAATDDVLGESRVSSYNVLPVGAEYDIARMHGEEIAELLAVGEP